MGRDDEFEVFWREAEPRLRRAFAGSHGPDLAADAVDEALAWAWEHWGRVQVMENAIGFLYRVGQSRSRPRLTPVLPAPSAVGLPEVEPQLVPALLALSPQQRMAVWLVHGCQWRYSETAEAMGISASAVGTHASRGLDRLRAALGTFDRG